MGLPEQIKKSQSVFSADDAKAAIHKVAPPPLIETILLDTKYWAVDRPTWDAMIADFGPDRNQYVSERYDCDNFASYFWGAMGHRYEVNGVGMVCNWTAGHAYNIILVVDQGQCVAEFIEPQNDQFVRTPLPKIYTLHRGLILI